MREIVQGPRLYSVAITRPRQGIFGLATLHPPYIAVYRSQGVKYCDMDTSINHIYSVQIRGVKKGIIKHIKGHRRSMRIS